MIENPLYQQLLDGGMDMKRAYALSEADLEMGDDTEALTVEEAGEDEYADNTTGRFARIRYRQYRIRGHREQWRISLNRQRQHQLDASQYRPHRHLRRCAGHLA